MATFYEHRAIFFFFYPLFIYYYINYFNTIIHIFLFLKMFYSLDSKKESTNPKRSLFIPLKKHWWEHVIVLFGFRNFFFKPRLTISSQLSLIFTRKFNQMQAKTFANIFSFLFTLMILFIRGNYEDFVIFIDDILKNSKFSPVYTWFYLYASFKNVKNYIIR